jgi:beta-N-acetylhexosaminidase
MDMSLESLAGELFMVGIDGTELTDEAARVLEQVKPGFIILFSRNIESPEQLYQLIKELRKVVKKPVVFSIDQEGGIVTRLRNGFTVSCGAMALAATKDENNAYLAGKILALEMKSLGITWNLAPVLDINDNPNNPGIGVRSFGDTPQKVIKFAKAFYKGLSEESVAACGKHFPGKGSVEVDAHLDMPVLQKSLEELKRWELIPFVELMKEGLESIMPSHIHLPQLQPDRLPATVSKEILTDLLRKTLNYHGIAVADDLLMGGITKAMSVEDAVINSFKSGMDVLSLCHEPQAQISAKKALLEQIKKNPDLEKRLSESLGRIKNFKEKFYLKTLPDEISFDFSDHEKIMDKIAEQSITLVSDEDKMIPLELSVNDCVITVKTSRLVQVQETQTGIPWVAKELSEKFGCELLVVDKDSKLVKKGKKCVFFTENAHLSTWQSRLLEQARSNFRQLLVVAMRNPYDCFLVNSSSICSYSYEMVSQRALFKVLLGEIKPLGELPVEVFK